MTVTVIVFFHAVIIAFSMSVVISSALLYFSTSFRKRAADLRLFSYCVCSAFKGELIVTENGIATDDDTRRTAFIEQALSGFMGTAYDFVAFRCAWGGEIINLFYAEYF